MYWKVSFMWADGVYCANIARGSRTDVENYYSTKYEWVSVSPASDREVIEAREKGMPAITVKPVRKFFDTETRQEITIDELRAVYESDPTLREEYATFGEYIRCCQTAEGGTLEEIH